MSRVDPRSLRSPFFAVLAAIRLFAAMLTMMTTTSPAWSHPGAWSPPSSSWGGIAVHMALLRGDDGSPYHSRVVWWQGEGVSATFVGGQWGWKQGVGNANCSDYPGSALIAIALPTPGPPPLDNLFCAGHSQLADGRLMTVGGTEYGTENGLKVANILNTGAGSDAGSWAASVDSMAAYRYYPAATTLFDGRVAAFSGNKYPHIECFGGRKDAAPTPAVDAILRFALAFKGIWDPSIEKPTGSPTWPPYLTGLSAVMSRGFGKVQYFGGRDSDGDLRNDVWASSRRGNTTTPDYEYTWVNRRPLSGSHPDPRMDHTATMIRDGIDSTRSMVIFGGLAKPFGQPEAPTNDVWRHFFKDTTDRYQWRQIIITNPGSAPSARYGHTSFLDEDNNRLLVFGGTAAAGAPTDYTVYALSFDNFGAPDSATWSEPTTLYSGTYPSARYHHSMEADVVTRSYSGVHLKSGVLFGGRSGSGRKNDVWRLWISVTGDTVSWQSITTAGTPPTACESHTGTYESGSARLMVFGGETSTGPADGVVRVLDLDETPTPTWRPFADRGYSLAGHTAVISGLIFARSPELYTVGTNDWSQTPTSPHLQEWFPQMFQLWNGKVFEAGPAMDSYTFNPQNGQWDEFPASSPPDSEIVGGSAVMYRPGKVMKSGSRGHDGTGSTAVSTTKYIELEAGTGWRSSGSMAVGRSNHNLVLLPNGTVLVTGGLGTTENNTNASPRRRPEV